MAFPNTDDVVHGVLVIRHGLTQWNADQRWQGWADIPLSVLGRRQAEYAAGTVSEIFERLLRNHPLTGADVRVVSSDLQRASATAQAFADALGAAGVDQIEAFRERHVGEWAGLTAREIAVRWPGLLERWRGGESVSLPGGEDEIGFRTRILRALTDEARRSADNGRPAIVVSHGGAIRTIESLLNIDARHVANVGGRWFYWNGDGVTPGAPIDLLDDLDDLDRPDSPDQHQRRLQALEAHRHADLPPRPDRSIRSILNGDADHEESANAAL